MYSTRTAPEWRDDMPRSFSFADLPPHVPTIQHRRRLLSTALMIPRLVAVSSRR